MFLRIALPDDISPARLLRIARRARGLRLQDVSALWGKHSAPWLCRVEKGHVPLSSEEAQEILAAIGATVISPRKARQRTPRAQKINYTPDLQETDEKSRKFVSEKNGKK